MNILGINFFYHDSTACLVQDGQLVVAIEEERLTRNKHTWAFPVNAIERCLAIAKLTYEDVDHVAVSINPRLDRGKKIWYGLKNIGNLRTFARHELINSRNSMRRLHAWYEQAFRSKKPQLHLVPHHASHIIGSFFVSPYESAALLSVDGSGEWASSFMGRGHADRRIECYRQDYFPYSLGAAYEAVTQFCGFKANYDEGKTMGLAPFGRYRPELQEKVNRLFWINDDMSIGMDFSYFGYQFWGHDRCNQKFYDTFGQPRKQDKNAVFEDRHNDLAWAFQHNLENCLLKIARLLREKTQEDYLVISGGVSLNSVANGRIVRESGFKDLYVMPAAGDNGTAIGAAFYVWNDREKLNNPRSFVHMNPYIGTQYSNEQIEAVLKESKLSYQYYDDIEAVTAAELTQGKFIGWFQGAMEIGPRALGNRSILADPTIAGAKDKLNAEVKHREAYRPFAPSACIEDVPRFFESNVADPFMLKVCNVLPEYRDKLPAITHVDGTARLQTVHQDTNPRYYKLIKEMEKRNGFPVVLNTSFNIMGEPIVESVYHAIRCFFTTGLDVLVLGNYMVKK
jgi:carbamoyltransferase